MPWKVHVPYEMHTMFISKNTTCMSTLHSEWIQLYKKKYCSLDNILWRGMILRELYAWCWQVGILHLLISIFLLSLWDIFPILSSVVYYCEVFYLFWVQCLSQWLGCNFLIVEGVLPVAGVLHGQNLVQHHGKPGHSECLWWGSIPGEQHWRCNPTLSHPTPPHFTSKKNVFWI